jgi:hypothetical protein
MGVETVSEGIEELLPHDRIDRTNQINDFFTKNRVKTALRVGAGDILFHK